MIYEQQLQTH